MEILSKLDVINNKLLFKYILKIVVKVENLSSKSAKSQQFLDTLYYVLKSATNI
jgi:hypothetical protein